MPSPDKKNQEKKALIIGFALILIVLLITFFKPIFKKDKLSDSGSNSQKEIQEYPQISFSELQEKIRTNGSLQIIDVRSSDFYGAEHITDSMNIPIEELESSNIGTDMNKPMVILSEGSELDKEVEYQAIQLIKSKGFKDVKALSGGMISWKSNYGQTISWGDPSSFVDHSKVTSISPEDFKKSISNGNPIFILDVRLPSSFSSGHIANAVNVPLDDLEKRRSEISSGKNIIVYGDTELQGFQAAVKLYDLNFFSVQSLQGGFSSWTDKKMEIVK